MIVQAAAGDGQRAAVAPQRAERLRAARTAATPPGPAPQPSLDQVYRDEQLTQDAHLERVAHAPEARALVFHRLSLLRRHGERREGRCTERGCNQGCCSGCGGAGEKDRCADGSRSCARCHCRCCRTRCPLSGQPPGTIAETPCPFEPSAGAASHIHPLHGCSSPKNRVQGRAASQAARSRVSNRR